MRGYGTHIRRKENTCFLKKETTTKKHTFPKVLNEENFLWFIARRDDKMMLKSEKEKEFM